MTHDPKCPVSQGPCCPWMGDCDCQCLCDFIAEIRQDQDVRVVAKMSEIFETHASQAQDDKVDLTETVESSYPLCGHCHQPCSAPLPMEDDTSQVYAALYRGGTLKWSEDEDCGMRNLMWEVAETAAAALRFPKG